MVTTLMVYLMVWDNIIEPRKVGSDTFEIIKETMDVYAKIRGISYCGYWLNDYFEQGIIQYKLLLLYINFTTQI